MKEKIVNVMIRCVIVGIVAILIFLGVMACVKTGYFANECYNGYHEKIIYKTDNILFNITGLIIGLMTLYLLYRALLKIKNNKYLFIFFAVIYCVLSIIWVIISKSPLRADSRVVSDAAKDFVMGNYSLLNYGQYLYNHPLQLGIVFAMEIVYRIVGINNTIIFKFLNIIFSLIAFIYLYKISNKIFKNEKIQKILIVLMAGALMFVIFNVFVYGNIVGMMFGIIAIYYTINYLENRKIKNLVITGISIIFAIILKSNYQVYMIGIFIALILDLFKKVRLANIITIIFVTIVVLFQSTLIIKFAEKRTGLEISSGIPMISYIHMGMARPVDRSAGWYNIDVNVEKTFIEANHDPKVASQISEREIKERIKDMINTPADTVKFYVDKILSTWIEPTFQTIWTSEPQERADEVPEIAGNKILISIFDGKLNKVLLKYLDLFDILIFISAAVYCISNFKRIGNKEFLLIVIFLGGFLFHILWETKSIYAIPFFILLLPYSAAGIYQMFEKIDKKIIKKEKLLSDGSN